MIATGLANQNLGWKRAKIPALELSFPDPRPRYDFDRKSVVFLGEDSGGEVRCEITGEALRDHFGVHGSNPRDYVAKYEERSPRFKKMALEKYRSWPIEEPGIILLREEYIPELLCKVSGSLTPP